MTISLTLLAYHDNLFCTLNVGFRKQDERQNEWKKMNEEEDNGEETRESEWSYYSHMHIATRELIRAKGFASWNPKSLLTMTGAHTNGLLVDVPMYFVPL